MPSQFEQNKTKFQKVEEFPEWFQLACSTTTAEGGDESLVQVDVSWEDSGSNFWSQSLDEELPIPTTDAKREPWESEV